MRPTTKRSPNFPCTSLNRATRGSKRTARSARQNFASCCRRSTNHGCERGSACSSSAKRRSVCYGLASRRALQVAGSYGTECGGPESNALFVRRTSQADIIFQAPRSRVGGNFNLPKPSESEISRASQKRHEDPPDEYAFHDPDRTINRTQALKFRFQVVPALAALPRIGLGLSPAIWALQSLGHGQPIVLRRGRGAHAPSSSGDRTSLCAHAWSRRLYPRRGRAAMHAPRAVRDLKLDFFAQKRDESARRERLPLRIQAILSSLSRSKRSELQV
jgi:hypothetical protein